jgi:pimeloyl-ACP methyl ester carboxylesterase
MILLEPVATGEWAEAGKVQRATLERGARLSRRGGMLARIGVVRLSLDLLMAGSHVIPRVVGRAASGAGVHVADRLVGEVRKMPRELWPIVQAHWSLPKCFASMGDHLRRLPESAAAVASTEMPATIPLAVLLADDASAIRRREYSELAGTNAVIIPNTGHWIQLDQPQLVVDAIREMLTRLPSTSAHNESSQPG